MKNPKCMVKLQFLIMITLVVQTFPVRILALGGPPYPSASWSANGGRQGELASYGCEASADKTTGMIYGLAYTGVTSGSAWAYAWSNMIDYYSTGSAQTISKETLFRILSKLHDNENMDFLKGIMANLDSTLEVTKDESIRNEIKKAKEFFYKSILEDKIPPQIDAEEMTKKESQRIGSSGTKVAYATVYLDGAIDRFTPYIPPFLIGYWSYYHRIIVYLRIYDSTTGSQVAGDIRVFSEVASYSTYVSLSTTWNAQSGHSYVIIAGMRAECSLSGYGNYMATVNVVFTRNSHVTYISVQG
jgi:hypothetical protein